jgi:hypothetical protein
VPAGDAVYVPLPGGAPDALRRLARREHRHPRDQALVLVLDGLRRAGELDEHSELGTHAYGAVAPSVGSGGPTSGDAVE